LGTVTAGLVAQLKMNPAIRPAFDLLEKQIEQAMANLGPLDAIDLLDELEGHVRRLCAERMEAEEANEDEGSS
jgi:Mg/Co/Ni transporter MgtE